MRDISNESRGFQLFCWFIHKIYQEELFYISNTDEGQALKEKTYEKIMRQISQENGP